MFQVGQTRFVMDSFPTSDETVYVTTGKLGAYRVRIGTDTLDTILVQIGADPDHDVVVSDDYFAPFFQNARPVYRHVLFVHASETNKTIETVVHLLDAIPTTFSKTNKFIILGGGILQDIGGFLAGIYKRGVPYILIPTTLLAMTDSAIGSKVCLNHGRSKNQLGLFYPPVEIVLSTCFLSSLSDDMIQSGLGESLKLALLAGEDSFRAFVRLYDNRDYEAIIQQSLHIKKIVIEKDEYELDERKCLNYGHTIGHAIEASTGYAIPHGIAVLFGIYFVNRLFVPDCQWTHEVHMFLWDMIPAHYKTHIWDLEQIMKHLRTDKKNKGSQIGFIVLDKPGLSRFYHIEAALVESMLRAVLDESYSVGEGHRHTEVDDQRLAVDTRILE